MDEEGLRLLLEYVQLYNIFDRKKIENALYRDIDSLKEDIKDYEGKLKKLNKILEWLEGD